MGNFAASDFGIQSTCHIIRDKITGQIILGQDMVLPIRPIAKWNLLHQIKHVQIEIYITHKISTRIEYYYNVGYQVFLINKSSYKYKIPIKGTCKIKYNG